MTNEEKIRPRDDVGEMSFYDDRTEAELLSILEWRSARRRFWLKTIASVLVFTFLFQEVSRAADIRELMQQRQERQSVPLSTQQDAQSRQEELVKEMQALEEAQNKALNKETVPGNVVTTNIDATGNVVSQVYEDGKVVTFNNNLIDTITEATGDVAVYSYVFDQTDPTKITQITITKSNGSFLIYNENGNIVSYTFTSGETINFDNGRISSYTKDGVTTNYSYELDNEGNVAKIIATLNNGDIVTYSPDNKVLSIKYASDNKVVLFENNLISKIIYQDGTEDNYSYARDASENIVETTVVTPTLTLKYDYSNRLKSLMGQDNVVYEFIYNINGIVIKNTETNDQTYISQDGQILKEVYNNGTIREYVYANGVLTGYDLKELAASNLVGKITHLDLNDQVIGEEFPDNDNDGVTNLREIELGTNPLIEDTDNDGINDNNELTIGTNPLTNDSDADGVPDKEELDRGINPLSSDSDGDGILDKDELMKGLNPALVDSDVDGVNDNIDAFPLDASASKDTDKDGKPDTITGTSTTGLIKDDDSDADGYTDDVDAFPFDLNEWSDVNKNGIGDNNDPLYKKEQEDANAAFSAYIQRMFAPLPSTVSTIADSTKNLIDKFSKKQDYQLQAIYFIQSLGLANFVDWLDQLITGRRAATDEDNELPMVKPPQGSAGKKSEEAPEMPAQAAGTQEGIDLIDETVNINIEQLRNIIKDEVKRRTVISNDQYETSDIDYALSGISADDVADLETEIDWSNFDTTWDTTGSYPTMWKSYVTDAGWDSLVKALVNKFGSDVAGQDINGDGIREIDLAKFRVYLNSTFTKRTDTAGTTISTTVIFSDGSKIERDANGFLVSETDKTGKKTEYAYKKDGEGNILGKFVIKSDGTYEEIVGETVVKSGNEVDFAKLGDAIGVKYTGSYLNGEVFDTNENSSTLLNFSIGSGSVIKGFEDAVVGLRLGEEVTVVIPPERAYGLTGTHPMAGQTLVFKIKLEKLNGEWYSNKAQLDEEQSLDVFTKISNYFDSLNLTPLTNVSQMASRVIDVIRTFLESVMDTANDQYAGIRNILSGTNPVLLTQTGINGIISYLNNQITNIINCATNVLNYFFPDQEKEKIAIATILYDILTGVTTELKDSNADLKISFESIARYANAKGFDLKAYKIDPDNDLVKITQPGVAFINGNHYVVIVSVADGNVNYNDNGVSVTESIEEFKEKFNGEILTSEEIDGAVLLTDDENKNILGQEVGNTIYVDAPINPWTGELVVGTTFNATSGLITVVGFYGTNNSSITYTINNGSPRSMSTAYFKSTYGANAEGVIQAAINSANYGDTVMLGEGTFNFYSGSIKLKQGVRLLGQGADKTKIVKNIGGYTSMVAVDHANDVVISGITFEGIYNNGPRYGIWVDRSRNVTIENNTFRYMGSGGNGGAIGVGWISGSYTEYMDTDYNILINNNKFLDTRDAGIFLDYAAATITNNYFSSGTYYGEVIPYYSSFFYSTAIKGWGRFGGIIKDNVINNMTRGFELESFSDAAYEPSDPLIENNTINNTKMAINIIQANPTIRNNIIINPQEMAVNYQLKTSVAPEDINVFENNVFWASTLTFDSRLFATYPDFYLNNSFIDQQPGFKNYNPATFGTNYSDFAMDPMSEFISEAGAGTSDTMKKFYDSNGSVNRIVYPDNSEVRYTWDYAYDDDNNITGKSILEIKKISPSGVVSTYENFNAIDTGMNPIITEEDGVFYGYEFDPETGLPSFKTVTDGEYELRFEYIYEGGVIQGEKLISSEDYDGNVTTYNNDGMVSTIMTSSGIKVYTYIKDSSGQIIKVIVSSGTTSVNQLNRDENGNVLSIYDSKGRKLDFNIDGLVIKITETTGETYTFNYSSKGISIINDILKSLNLNSFGDPIGSLYDATSMPGSRLGYLLQNNGNVISECLLRAIDNYKYVVNNDSIATNNINDFGDAVGTTYSIIDENTIRVTYPDGTTKDLDYFELNSSNVPADRAAYFVKNYRNKLLTADFMDQTGFLNAILEIETYLDNNNLNFWGFEGTPGTGFIIPSDRYQYILSINPELINRLVESVSAVESSTQNGGGIIIQYGANGKVEKITNIDGTAFIFDADGKSTALTTDKDVTISADRVRQIVNNAKLDIVSDFSFNVNNMSISSVESKIFSDYDFDGYRSDDDTTMLTPTAGLKVKFSYKGLPITYIIDITTGEAYPEPNLTQKVNAFKNSIADLAARTGISEEDITLKNILEGTPVNNTDMAAFYKFDGNANDMTGNNYNGTIYGSPVLVNGQSGRGYNFNGTSDYISLGNNNNLSLSNFTVTSWFKWDGPITGQNFRTIVSRGEGGSGYTQNYMIYVGNDGKVGARVGNGGTTETYFTSDVNINDGKMHFVALAYDSDKGTGQLYVDGIASTLKTGLLPAYTSTASTTSIGIWQSANYGKWDGVIDEVRIYNKALTNSQIQTLRTKEADPEGTFDNETTAYRFFFSANNFLYMYNSVLADPDSKTYMDPAIINVLTNDVASARTDLYNKIRTVAPISSASEIKFEGMQEYTFADDTLGGFDPTGLSTTKNVKGYKLFFTFGGLVAEYHLRKGATTLYCATNLNAVTIPLIYSSINALVSKSFIGSTTDDKKAVAIASVQKMIWDDETLGGYRTDITPSGTDTEGYKIILSYGAKTYEFHTNLTNAYLIPELSDMYTLVSDAKAYLVTRTALKDAQFDIFNLVSADFKLISVEKAQWADRTLGGYSSDNTVESISGYKIVFQAKGNYYEFHTYKDGAINKIYLDPVMDNTASFGNNIGAIKNAISNLSTFLACDKNKIKFVSMIRPEGEDYKIVLKYKGITYEYDYDGTTLTLKPIMAGQPLVNGKKLIEAIAKDLYENIAGYGVGKYDLYFGEEITLAGIVNYNWADSTLDGYDLTGDKNVPASGYVVKLNYKGMVFEYHYNASNGRFFLNPNIKLYDAVKVSFKVDELGRLKSITDSNGQDIFYLYGINKYGESTTFNSKVSLDTVTEYDVNGNRLSTSYYDGSKITYYVTNDERNGLTKEVFDSMGALGYRYIYTVDAAGQVETRTLLAGPLYQGSISAIKHDMSMGIDYSLLSIDTANTGNGVWTFKPVRFGTTNLQLVNQLVDTSDTDYNLTRGLFNIDLTVEDSEAAGVTHTIIVNSVGVVIRYDGEDVENGKIVFTINKNDTLRVELRNEITSGKGAYSWSLLTDGSLTPVADASSNLTLKGTKLGSEYLNFYNPITKESFFVSLSIEEAEEGYTPKTVIVTATNNINSSITLKMGDVVKFDLDSNWKLSPRVDTMHYYVYNAFGDIDHDVAQDGTTIYYSTDDEDKGIIIRKVDKYGRTIYDRNSENKPVTVTDKYGNFYYYEYLVDGEGYTMTKVTLMDGTPGAPGTNSIRIWKYNELGELISEMDARYPQSEITYQYFKNSSGKITGKLEIGLNIHNMYEYAPDGKLTRVTDIKNKVSTYTYTKDSENKDITLVETEKYIQTFNSDGDLIKNESKVNADDVTTYKYVKDPNGALIAKYEMKNNVVLTKYEYTKIGLTRMVPDSTGKFNEKVDPLVETKKVQNFPTSDVLANIFKQYSKVNDASPDVLLTTDENPMGYSFAPTRVLVKLNNGFTGADLDAIINEIKTVYGITNITKELISGVTYKITFTPGDVIETKYTYERDYFNSITNSIITETNKVTYINSQGDVTKIVDKSAKTVTTFSYLKDASYGFNTQVTETIGDDANGDGEISGAETSYVNSIKYYDSKGRITALIDKGGIASGDTQSSPSIKYYYDPVTDLLNRAYTKSENTTSFYYDSMVTDSLEKGVVWRVEAGDVATPGSGTLKATYNYEYDESTGNMLWYDEVAYDTFVLDKYDGTTENLNTVVTINKKIEYVYTTTKPYRLMMIKAKDKAGKITRHYYNTSTGELVRSYSEENNLTYFYDAKNNISDIYEGDLGAKDISKLKTHYDYTYDASGQITRSVETRYIASGTVTATETNTTDFDSIGRISKVTDKAGHEYFYYYQSNPADPTPDKAKFNKLNYIYDQYNDTTSFYNNAGLLKSVYKGNSANPSVTDLLYRYVYSASDFASDYNYILLKDRKIGYKRLEGASSGGYGNEDFTNTGIRYDKQLVTNYSQGTVEFWYQPEWASGKDTSILKCATTDTVSSTSYLGIYMRKAGTANNKIYFRYGVNETNAVTLDLDAPADDSPFKFANFNNKWHHFAITWSGGRFYAYIDGTLIGSATFATPSLPSTFYFGNGSVNATSRGLNGTVDNIVGFNYGKTLDQLKEDYLSTPLFGATGQTFFDDFEGTNSATGRVAITGNIAKGGLITLSETYDTTYYNGRTGDPAYTDVAAKRGKSKTQLDVLNNRTYAYEYDNFGNLKYVYDQKNNQTSYYDDKANVTDIYKGNGDAAKLPANLLYHYDYTFDENGNIIQRKDTRKVTVDGGQVMDDVTTNIYDINEGKIVEVIDNNNNKFYYEYTPVWINGVQHMGDLRTIYDEFNGQTTFYDATGNVTDVYKGDYRGYNNFIMNLNGYLSPETHLVHYNYYMDSKGAIKRSVEKYFEKKATGQSLFIGNNQAVDYSRTGILSTFATGTLDMWVKPMDVTSVHNYFYLGAGGTGGTEQHLRLAFDPTSIGGGKVKGFIFTMGNGTSKTEIAMNGNVEVGEWYKLTVTWNFSATTKFVALYVNGEQRAYRDNTTTFYYPTTISSTTYPKFRIGNVYTVTTTGANAFIDNIRFTSSTVTGRSQVADDYKGLYPGNVTTLFSADYEGSVNGTVTGTKVGMATEFYKAGITVQPTVTTKFYYNNDDDAGSANIGKVYRSFNRVETDRTKIDNIQYTYDAEGYLLYSEDKTGSPNKKIVYNKRGLMTEYYEWVSTAYVLKKTYSYAYSDANGNLGDVLSQTEYITGTQKYNVTTFNSYGKIDTVIAYDNNGTTVLGRYKYYYDTESLVGVSYAIEKTDPTTNAKTTDYFNKDNFVEDTYAGVYGDLTKQLYHYEYTFSVYGNNLEMETSIRFDMTKPSDTVPVAGDIYFYRSGKYYYVYDKSIYKTNTNGYTATVGDVVSSINQNGAVTDYVYSGGKLSYTTYKPNGVDGAGALRTYYKDNPLDATQRVADYVYGWNSGTTYNVPVSKYYVYSSISDTIRSNDVKFISYEYDMSNYAIGTDLSTFNPQTGTYANLFTKRGYLTNNFNGNLMCIIDKNGARTDYFYNTNGLAFSFDQTKKQFTYYDDKNQPRDVYKGTYSTTPDENALKLSGWLYHYEYTFDSKLTLQTIKEYDKVNGNGLSIREYDEDGNLTAYTDRFNNRTTYTYTNGILTKSHDLSRKRTTLYYTTGIEKGQPSDIYYDQNGLGTGEYYQLKHYTYTFTANVYNISTSTETSYDKVNGGGETLTTTSTTTYNYTTVGGYTFVQNYYITDSDNWKTYYYFDVTANYGALLRSYSERDKQVTEFDNTGNPVAIYRYLGSTAYTGVAPVGVNYALLADYAYTYDTNNLIRTVTSNNYDKDSYNNVITQTSTTTYFYSGNSVEHTEMTDSTGNVIKNYYNTDSGRLISSYNKASNTTSFFDAYSGEVTSVYNNDYTPNKTKVAADLRNSYAYTYNATTGNVTNITETRYNDSGVANGTVISDLYYNSATGNKKLINKIVVIKDKMGNVTDKVRYAYDSDREAISKIYNYYKNETSTLDNFGQVLVVYKGNMLGEDLDNDAVIDAGEDIDQDGTLDAAIALSNQYRVRSYLYTYQSGRLVKSEEIVYYDYISDVSFKSYKNVTTYEYETVNGIAKVKKVTVKDENDKIKGIYFYNTTSDKLDSVYDPSQNELTYYDTNSSPLNIFEASLDASNNVIKGNQKYWLVNTYDATYTDRLITVAKYKGASLTVDNLLNKSYFSVADGRVEKQEFFNGSATPETTRTYVYVNGVLATAKEQSTDSRGQETLVTYFYEGTSGNERMVRMIDPSNSMETYYFYKGEITPDPNVIGATLNLTGITLDIDSDEAGSDNADMDYCISVRKLMDGSVERTVTVFQGTGNSEKVAVIYSLGADTTYKSNIHPRTLYYYDSATGKLINTTESNPNRPNALAQGVTSLTRYADVDGEQRAVSYESYDSVITYVYKDDGNLDYTITKDKRSYYGAQTSYYDADGKITLIKDKNEIMYYFEYPTDANGYNNYAIGYSKTVQKIYYKRSGAEVVSVSKEEYTAHSTDPAYFVVSSSKEYNNNSEMIESVDENGISTKYSYLKDSASGRTKYMYTSMTYTDPTNASNVITNVKGYEYYVESTVPASVPASQKAGWIGQIKALIDENGHKTMYSNYAFDDKGNVASVRETDWAFRGEDVNGNGVLDAGEDTNSNGQLDSKYLDKYFVTETGSINTYGDLTMVGELDYSKDNKGNRIYYQYNKDYKGNRTRITQTFFSYEGGATDPYSYSMTTYYNADGSIKALTDKNGNNSSFTYEWDNKLNVIASHETTTRHEDINNDGTYEYIEVKKTKNFYINGAVMSEVEDRKGTDAQFNKTITFTYTNDSLGNTTKMRRTTTYKDDINQDGVADQTITFYEDTEYNLEGDVVKFTDKNSRVTEYAYLKDALGNVTSSIEKASYRDTDINCDGVIDANDQVTNYSQKFFEDGSLVSIIDQNGAETRIGYERFATGDIKKRIEYKKIGKDITTGDEQFVATGTIEYDLLGNPIASTNEYGIVKNITYNRNYRGEITEVINTTPARNNKVERVVMDPRSGDNLQSIDNNGNITKFSYTKDAKGNILTATQTKTNASGVNYVDSITTYNIYGDM